MHKLKVTEEKGKNKQLVTDVKAVFITKPP